jgi:hypothetical protein
MDWFNEGYYGLTTTTTITTTTTTTTTTIIIVIIIIINEEKRIAYSLLVGKPEGKWPLGRSRRRWVDNIRINLLELGWGDMNWIGLAQDRDRWRALVNSASFW